MTAKLFVTALALGILVSWSGSVAAQAEPAPDDEAAGRKTMGVVAYLVVSPRRPLLPSIEPPESPEQYQLLKRTTIELIRAKPLLIRALRDPAIANAPLVKEQIDPVEWLQDNLTFDYPRDSEILRIRLRTHHAEDGATVLNTIVNAFFKEVVEREIIDRAKEEQLVRKLYEEKRERVVRLTSEVLAMRKEIGNDQAQDSPEIALRQAEIKQLQTVAEALDARSQQLQIQKHERPQIRKLDEAVVEIFREPPKDGV